MITRRQLLTGAVAGIAVSAAAATLIRTAPQALTHRRWFATRYPGNYDVAVWSQKDETWYGRQNHSEMYAR